MKHIKWKNLMLIGGVLILASCTTNDSEELDLGLEVTNDKEVLNARMIQRNQPISISSSTNGRKEQDFELMLKAELQPPLVNGSALQATSIIQKGKFLAVSYNTAGEVYGGGIDLITEDLEVTSQALLESDINDLEFFANSLYFAGSTNSSSSPAFVGKVDVNTGKGEIKNSTEVIQEVGSFTANSITEFEGVIYATTGDNADLGGGVYRFSTAMDLNNYQSIEDARWVVGSGSYIYCLSGEPSKISALDRNNLDLVFTIDHSSETLPEAKQTIDIDDDMIFVAGGEKGVLIYDEDGQLVKNLTFDGNSITNAVSAEKGRLFISNGEGGVYVATYKKEIEILGKLELNSKESVNHILANGDYLYVASGLGGVKVIEIDD